MTPFTHFLYDRASGLMDIADFVIVSSLDCDAPMRWNDFIHEINKSRASTCLGISDRDIDLLERAAQERARAYKPVKYDTVCQHCGAPAKTMFFNVECSKGCTQ